MGLKTWAVRGRDGSQVNIQRGEKEWSIYLEVIPVATVKLRFVLLLSGKTNGMDVGQPGDVRDRFNDHCESGGVTSEGFLRDPSWMANSHGGEGKI
jgi:hypothetical protein